jgi:hypothetical protein
MKNSPLGNYISKYMTSTIEAIRLLSLVPMAWGAWIHNLWSIALGFLILLLAWCNRPTTSRVASAAPAASF